MPRLSIYFARMAYSPQLTLKQAFDRHSFADDLKTAIDPDLTVTRYNRTWRFSQPKGVGRGFLVGKLGFVSPMTETRTDYDEDRKDFIESSVDSRQGHYVQWAVDLSSRVIAFADKPPDIRFQSFFGAFGGLLCENPEIGLTLEHILESEKFFDWASKLDRITKFRANIRAPNPDFASRPQIIVALLQDTNADSARVELTSNESLNTEKTIHDLVEYGEDGYSTIMAHGEESGQQKVFDSRRQVSARRLSISPRLMLDADAIWARIVDALREFRS